MTPDLQQTDRGPVRPDRSKLNQQAYLSKRWWTAAERHEAILEAVRKNAELPRRPRRFTLEIWNEQGELVARKSIQLLSREDPRSIRVTVRAHGRLLGATAKPGAPPEYRRTLQEIAREFGIHPGTLSRIIAGGYERCGE